MNRLRIHTSHDIDPFNMGQWVVEVDGRVVKRANAFVAARYAAEVRRLNPDLADSPPRPTDFPLGS